MFKKGDIVTLKKSRKKDFFARKDCLFRCGITKNMITLYKQNGERLKVVKTEDNGALFPSVCPQRKSSVCRENDSQNLNLSSQNQALKGFLQGNCRLFRRCCRLFSLWASGSLPLRRSLQ